MQEVSITNSGQVCSPSQTQTIKQRILTCRSWNDFLQLKLTVNQLITAIQVQTKLFDNTNANINNNGMHTFGEQIVLLSYKDKQTTKYIHAMSCQIQSRIGESTSYNNSLRNLIYKAVKNDQTNHTLNEQELKTIQESQYQSSKSQMGHIRRSFQSNPNYLISIQTVAPVFYHIYILAVELFFP